METVPLTFHGSRSKRPRPRPTALLAETQERTLLDVEPSNVPHLQEFSRRLPPLSIGQDDDDDAFLDDDFDNYNWNHERGGGVIIHAHFRLPSVRLPSQENLRARQGYCLNLPRCHRSVNCCVLILLVTPLLFYLGQFRETWLPSVGSIGNVLAKELSGDAYTPTVHGDYSTVHGVDDVVALSKHVRVQCFHNQTFCPCQSSSNSNSSSISDHTLSLTTTFSNSRLTPRPGTLPGWDVAHTWNVQTTSSSARGSQANVVFLGDSITERWRGTQLGRHIASSLQPDVVATAEIFDRLFRSGGSEYEDKEEEEEPEEEEHENNVPNATASLSPSSSIVLEGLPLGIAGDQTPNLLWRLENGELQPNLNPAVFVVLIGTNDISFDRCSAENVVVGILRIVEYLLEQRSYARVLLHGLLPRTFDKKGYLASGGRDETLSHSMQPKSVWSTIQAVNDELKRYAGHRSGVDYWEAPQIFLKNRHQIDLELMPDGTHPSARGYELWGRELKANLQELVK